MSKQRSSEYKKGYAEGMCESMNQFQRGKIEGQQSCASSPWIYRTDTGDEYGKVVESAELPADNLNCEQFSDNEDKSYLGEIRHQDGSGGFRIVEFGEPDPEDDEINYYIDHGWIKTDWLRKHLIAYAEIRS